MKNDTFLVLLTWKKEKKKKFYFVSFKGAGQQMHYNSSRDRKISDLILGLGRVYLHNLSVELSFYF